MAEADLDNLKYEIEEEARTGARIKVVGVGGGGVNAVSRLVQAGLTGVEFHAMDTDRQSLSACAAPNKLQLGVRVTKGLGAGSNAELGRQAALENTDDIVELLQGADMVFVAASLGGGTGTGAAPVVASLAKELEALTVAVVTKPFKFEGPRRGRMADDGLESMASSVDTVITIPNDRLLALAPKGVSFVEAFKLADDLLRQAVEGVSGIINTTGAVNLDFADIRAVMGGMGHAIMGTAMAKGENAAVEAARLAISCPLLEDTRIAGAQRILMNVSGACASLGFHEVSAACQLVQNAAGWDGVELDFGMVYDEALKDAVKVTVIATGFNPANVPAQPPARQSRHITVVTPVTEPIAAPEPEPEPEPEPVAVAEPAPLPQPEPEPDLLSGQEPEIDMDDLDTPAYLRQRRTLG